MENPVNLVLIFFYDMVGRESYRKIPGLLLL
jgi:hypothetical protein